jgi:hypothetical protein
MRLQPMPAVRQRLLSAAVACCGLIADLRGKPTDRSFDRFPTEQELDAALAASKAVK